MFVEKQSMSTRIKQAVLLVVISVILAVVVNLVSARRIPFHGEWPSISGSDSVIVPPSAQPGDPPFISLDEAAAKFQSKNVVFIDARDTADFKLGRIRGAHNLPYDYYEDFWTSVMKDIPSDREIVIYCSGDECELSLFLGRELAARGYDKVFIFYGGWREWAKAKLPVEGMG